MSIKDQFLLNPDVIFLNHGSFGACPRPVFEMYQRWQLELERQPVEFLARRHDSLLDEARAVLGRYLNADPDNLVFTTNASSATNIVGRSLALQPGDEILATDQEYGALEIMWQFVCQQTGACYVTRPTQLPLTSPEDFVDAFWAGVTPRTRVIYISHVTTSTALILPVAEICRRAREAGIISIIDGAHAPGHIPVDIRAIDPDFYGGNCHKWMCAPKGSGFLYARREYHDILKPLMFSWGWTINPTFSRRIEQQGTRDLAAFLSVPAAVDFLDQHNWASVQRDCHALAVELVERMSEQTGLEPLADEAWFNQMVSLPLPFCDAEQLKKRLYDEAGIEVPILMRNERPYVRVSVQGYNTRADLDALVAALDRLL